MRISGAPKARSQPPALDTPVICDDCALLSRGAGLSASLRCLGSPGNPAGALRRAPSGRTRPHTHAPRAPTRVVVLGLPPTQLRVRGARARGGCAALLEVAAGAGMSFRRVLGCCGAGRVAPLSPPEPGYLRNSALGLWGAKCNPNPLFPNPAQKNTHKHAHRRRHGPCSLRQVLAAGGEGRAGGPRGVAACASQLEGRPPGIAAHRCDVSAWRHRPGSTAGLGLHLRSPGRAGAAARETW